MAEAELDTPLSFAALALGKEIGRGAFSTVYVGTFKEEQVAIKKVTLQAKDAEKYLMQELGLLKSMVHPNLIRYLGAAFNRPDIYIVTEFMDGGNLSAALRRSSTPPPWRLRCRIARDVCSGISFLHSHDVVHRDIKTENVLLDTHWRCVLADYGFARKAHKGTATAMTLCGTDEFMAPEMLFGETYDDKADVFSFGVLLWELMTCRVPGTDGFMLREPRSKFQLDFDALRRLVDPACPPSLLELAVQCCAYEAEYRLTSGEALEWLQALCDEFDAAAGGASDDTPFLGDVAATPAAAEDLEGGATV